MTRADRIVMTCLCFLYILISLYGVVMSIVGERWFIGCLSICGVGFWTWKIGDTNRQ
jgi:hypothetical protein